jgi:diketogulonate reductase-like aldo/keto reductase
LVYKRNERIILSPLILARTRMHVRKKVVDVNPEDTAGDVLRRPFQVSPGLRAHNIFRLLKSRPERPKMEYREFGRTKVRVSAIGMGTYYDVAWIAAARLVGYRQGREDKIAALKTGIELGINLIDTAEVYETEPLVAKAIRDYRRDALFIATKVSRSHLGYDQVLKAARRSIEKLQCSYVDLYQIHWPNSRVPIKETMRAMEKLVNEGKVRYIGVSNFSLSQTKEAEEAL